MLFALGRASTSKLPPSTLYKAAQRSPQVSSLSPRSHNRRIFHNGWRRKSLPSSTSKFPPSMPPSWMPFADMTTPFLRTLFRRNAVFLASVFSGAFAFELAFDGASNKVWDYINQGRQWKDIRHKYIQAAAEEEDDE
ncbi:ubiquinol-cytochrome C reductase complex, subunit X, putative [Paecilomyces variotii No. 5]|uniref:Complex III subunit 9 n=1 Tax=Byssochlamys spectabilis (strain No. 5 / NBRC 109023) TaxID=1356009 RepID=V5FNW3_BYSSN|nr:ubiquinol-cytochrome C reductase complex, subunit X, putative [Paecilomyces variotii No. 5]